MHTSRCGTQAFCNARYGRNENQIAADNSIVACAVGGADGTFQVSAFVYILASTSHSFCLVVVYTDEMGEIQTQKMPVIQLGGVMLVNMTPVTGIGPYPAANQQIRAKANTSITVKTIGTFTSVLYSAEGHITQIG